MPNNELQILRDKLDLLEKRIYDLEAEDKVNKIIIQELKVQVQDLKIQIEKGFDSLGEKIDSINNKPLQRHNIIMNAIMNSIGTLIGAGILYAIISNIKF